MQIDGRKLDHSTLEHLRISACQRVREGEPPSAVMRSMGLCRTTIYLWLKRERKEGLKSRKASGRMRYLNRRQRRAVRAWIVGKDPRRHGFQTALWTRRIISDLILVRLGVKLGLTAVGELLATLGVTPQKPLRRAYVRDEQLVEQWRVKDYPGIVKRAKKRGAKIFFLDEAGIISDAALGASWGEKGKTPEVRTSGQRQKVNAVSAVSPKGEFLFDIYTQRFNAAFFITILKKFTKGFRRPCFFIVDGHPAHRARSVKKFIQDSKGKIELHFLPPYAPDLNPDEFVWNYVKHNGTSKIPLRQNEALRKRVAKDLRAIKKRPNLVRAFFKAPSIDYASD